MQKFPYNLGVSIKRALRKKKSQGRTFYGHKNSTNSYKQYKQYKQFKNDTNKNMLVSVKGVRIRVKVSVVRINRCAY